MRTHKSNLHVPNLPDIPITYRGRILTSRHVMKRLRALIKKYGTRAKAAKKLGVSTIYLNFVMQGRRSIGPTISDYFGLTRHVVYLRSGTGRAPMDSGHLPFDADDPDVKEQEESEGIPWWERDEEEEG